MIFRSIYISLLALLFLGSCTKEPFNECPTGHYLEFEYTLNPEGVNLFEQEVTCLDVYIFYKDGFFVKTITTSDQRLKNDYKMYLNLEPGKYCFLVWAGKKDSYKIFDNDASDHEAGFHAGVSRIEDIRLQIRHNDYTVSDDFEDLYYYRAHAVEVKNQGESTLISLVKDCNTINFTVIGYKENLSKSITSLDSYLKIKNGGFNFNNIIDLTIPSIIYKPQEESFENGIYRSTLKTLALQTTISGSHLILESKDLGYNLVDIDPIKAIMKHPNITTDYDFLKYETFDIEVDISSNLGVKITVNGYVVQNVDSEIN
ncbi:MAG: FimB/Mfa2 family fimbrial subunit [Muribaculaceae bacterium]